MESSFHRGACFNRLVKPQLYKRMSSQTFTDQFNIFLAFGQISSISCNYLRRPKIAWSLVWPSLTYQDTSQCWTEKSQAYNETDLPFRKVFTLLTLARTIYNYAKASSRLRRLAIPDLLGNGWINCHVIWFCGRWIHLHIVKQRSFSIEFKTGRLPIYAKERCNFFLQNMPLSCILCK